MDINQKNQYIERYIKDIAKQMNNQYNANLMDEDKINRGIKIFINSSDDLETEIIPKINELAQKVIEDYLEFQRHIQEMMRRKQDEALDEVATLDLNTEKDGIYLSQQQVDLLMITELDSKEELKNYLENICGQFPSMSVEDIIPNFDSLQEDQLEDAKKNLYQKYQDSLISYLENAEIESDKLKQAKQKLSKMGLTDEEYDNAINCFKEKGISATYDYLGQLKGTEFITKFNRFMRDDFENIKDVSYDEMKSLSELISNDKTTDTIIIATGKFDNTIYQSMNGKIFDPYLTHKALAYCTSHDKHMRYHALFDQSHVENLLKQGKGLQDHDQILAEMKAYVKMSMDYIEKNNRQLSDGTMLINTVEVFNELVEKNKSDKDKNLPYAMVWAKHFGITTDELVSCFDGIKKPDGVEFMYNETTLTESPQKRAMVEKVLYQIDQKNPDLIDSFGDQMHLSDEDVITKKGRQNLTETAQMLKRFQDGKVIVDGQLKEIKPKKTECTEHDFHFKKSFLDNVEKIKQSGKNVDLWSVKRGMQSFISKTYKENGVNFQKSTYWSLIGKNDHNVVRENIKIQKENKERKQKGLPTKPLVKTMSAGLVPDGKKLPKTLKTKNQVKHQNDNKSNQLNVNSSIQNKKAELLKLRNQVVNIANQSQKNDQKQNTDAKVKKKVNNANKGFTDILILSLFTGFAAGVMTTIMYLIINN